MTDITPEQELIILERLYKELEDLYFGDIMLTYIQQKMLFLVQQVEMEKLDYILNQGLEDIDPDDYE